MTRMIADYRKRDALLPHCCRNFATQLLSKSFPVCLHMKHAKGGVTHEIHLFKLHVTAAKIQHKFYSGFLFAVALVTCMTVMHGLCNIIWKTFLRPKSKKIFPILSRNIFVRGECFSTCTCKELLGLFIAPRNAFLVDSLIYRLLVLVLW